MVRPLGIDLFAGAGGMSLGFEQAGFDIVAAVEIDPVHCAVHKFNFPDCTVIPKSVVGLTGSEVRVAAGLGRRRVDVVFGGAPCQGFSMIGQRVLDDPRNALVRDFLRLVSELDASSFVFENVKGLTLGRHRQFLEEFVALAEALGYSITAPWKVLNAAHFGVPQSRERLFVMGVKKGISTPVYPTPLTCPASGNDRGMAHLPAGPTVQDALGDLPDADRFPALSHGDSVRATSFGRPSDYALELRCLSNRAWHFGYPRVWDAGLLTSSATTEHSAISRRRFGETRCGTNEPISRFYKLAPEGLSNTLRAGTDGARGAFTSPRPIHYQFDRCITVREMARLHGYPDWFRFNETKWHGARQIGNSVPPPLARVVASQMLEALGYAGEMPSKAIDLGPPELLRMTVSEAAKHFGIVAPVMRRDQKSGARKRKQADIERERLAAYG